MLIASTARRLYRCVVCASISSASNTHAAIWFSTAAPPIFETRPIGPSADRLANGIHVNRPSRPLYGQPMVAHTINPDHLQAAVSDFGASDDGKTFVYFIDVSYCHVKWQLRRRFADFHALHSQLFTLGFGALPTIPSKSLVRPNDPEVAKIRQQRLHIYLLELLVRPDLRGSGPVLAFLEFEENSKVIVPDRCLRSCLEADSGGMAVADFAFDPETGLIAVAEQDVTLMSRFGKAWSLIEPEQLGAISIWQLIFEQTPGEPSSRFNPIIDSSNSIADTCLSLTRMFYQPTSIRMRAAHIRSRHIMFGTELGDLGVYTVADPQDIEKTIALIPGDSKKLVGDRRSQISLLMIEKVEMHIRARITQLRTDGELIGTIASDNGLRVCAFRGDPKRPQLEMLSGGRIVKSLKPEETLTSLLIDSASATAIVGTEFGSMLVYSILHHPPARKCRFDLVELYASTEGVPPGLDNAKKPLPKLAIQDLASTGNTLVVPLDSVILLLSLSQIIDCGKIEIKRRIECPFHPQLPIDALTIWQMPSGVTCLIAAHHRTLVLWDLEAGCILQCLEEFNWGRISQLKVYSVGRQWPVLFAASSNRGLQFISLHEWQHWLRWESGEEELRIHREERKAARAARLQQMESDETHEPGVSEPGDDIGGPKVMRSPAQDEIGSAEDIEIIRAIEPAKFKR